ncbi:MAG: hypothetical protein QMD09_01520, partial [Desulfatibacillaceae bacterium]|nr:hypothetical protein [Desulfatibacillaceae bacterium]
NSLLQQEATLRYASNPRLALEVILLRCCELTPVLSMDSIIQGLDQLEKKLSQQAFSGVCQPQAQVEPPQQPKPAESRTSDVKQDNRPEEKASGPAVNKPAEPSPPQATVKYAPGEITPPRPQDKAVSSPKKPGAGSFLQKLKEANPALGFQLEKCHMSFSENTFVIELDESLAAIAHGTDLAGKKALEDACAFVFGQDTVLELKLLPQPKPADRDDDNSWKKKALKHPLVNEAIVIFDGDIFDIVKHKIPAQPETALAGEDGQTAEE